LLELAVSAGDKAQVIDLDLLAGPLQAFPDQVGAVGALEGHISIAPAKPEGSVDQGLLEEWARTRNTDQVHWLTELVKKAHVGSVKRPR
jgi:hypothetical protein